MLVCGVLDTDGPAIAQYSWGRVIFDARLVVPLFEATSNSWYMPTVARVQPQLLPAKTVAASFFNAKVRLPKAAVAQPDGTQAFLARRAAQRRRS